MTDQGGERSLRHQIQRLGEKMDHVVGVVADSDVVGEDGHLEGDVVDDVHEEGFQGDTKNPVFQGRKRTTMGCEVVTSEPRQ